MGYYLLTFDQEGTDPTYNLPVPGQVGSVIKSSTSFGSDELYN
jgi:hypothetical protein